ncbi:MAG: hypothetical protein JO243_10120 [Solirubrobacterales bacterium]|nr:hypothetical protein [Solirubrobacterales bacterium]
MQNRPGRSRLPLAGLLVALLVVLGAAAALANGAPEAHPARAALALKSQNPVTVRGTGFQAHSGVTVTLFDGRTLVRRPVADRRGMFTASFPAVIDRCSAWSVTASQPGRAPVVLHGAKSECAPASTP